MESVVCTGSVICCPLGLSTSTWTRSWGDCDVVVIRAGLSANPEPSLRLPAYSGSATNGLASMAGATSVRTGERASVGIVLQRCAHVPRSRHSDGSHAVQKYNH